MLNKSAGLVPIRPGDLITYTLTYSNIGLIAAEQVVITETVPLNTLFLPTRSSAGWSCPLGVEAGSRCQLLLGSVAPRATGHVYYVVQVDRDLTANRPITNEAVIGSITVEREQRRENNWDSVTLWVSSPSALEEEDEPSRRVHQIFVPLIMRYYGAQ